MKYTVLWIPSAEKELARLWIGAEDRAAVSGAANTIDAVLRFDPVTVGESRSGEARILIIPPLVVTFAVQEADRRVSIFSVQMLPRSKA